MRAVMLQLAAGLGLDPLTLIVVSFLACACAWCMRELMPNPWLSFVFYPILVAAGVLAIGLATGLGVVEAIDVTIDGDGSFYAPSWNDAVEGLAMAVAAAIAGMSLAAVAIIQLTRALARYV